MLCVYLRGQLACSVRVACIYELTCMCHSHASHSQRAEQHIYMLFRACYLDTCWLAICAHHTPRPMCITCYPTCHPIVHLRDWCGANACCDTTKWLTNQSRDVTCLMWEVDVTFGVWRVVYMEWHILLRGQKPTSLHGALLVHDNMFNMWRSEFTNSTLDWIPSLGDKLAN